MERDNACDNLCERLGNLRFAQIADVMGSLDVELVNLGMKSRAHLRGASGEVNQRVAGIDGIDLESVRFEPARYSVNILLGYAEPLTKLQRGEPLVEVRGFGIVKIVDEFLKLPFQLRRALQLEQHMFHRKIFRDRSAIIGSVGLGAHVASNRHQLCFINVLSNERARAPHGLRAFSARKLGATCECQNASKDTRESRLYMHKSRSP